MNKIALIGSRSVGKSTIAKELQKLLKINLIDFDNYTEEELKKEGFDSINDFIQNQVKIQ